MKVVSVGLKGFIRDNGLWSWTPEVQLECDPLYPELTQSQKLEINQALTEARDAIKSTVERWNAEERAKRDALRSSVDKPVKVPPTNPAVVKELVTNQRKAGDEYDPEAKRWTRCICGNEDIQKYSAAGKPYQCCDECGLFLNPDGTVKAKGAK